MSEQKDKLATVVGFFPSGAAQVQFDGEDVPSEKEYAYFKSYMPVEGDRVFMQSFADSYIILGALNHLIAPGIFDGLLTEVKIPGSLVVEEGVTASRGGFGSVNAGALTVGKIEDVESKIGEIDGNHSDLSSALDKEIEERKSADSNIQTENGRLSQRIHDVNRTIVLIEATADSAKRTAESTEKTANNNSNRITNLYNTVDKNNKDLDARLKKEEKRTSYDSLQIGKVGFYYQSPTYKTSVSTTTASDITGLRNKLNELINALRSYGLI